MSKTPNRFGLLAFLHWNHEWNKWHFPESLLPKALDQIQALGVGCVRIDILWSDVHRGADRYDFDRYDALVDGLRARGIEILALLHYNKLRDGEKGLVWNKPPDSFEEFGRYVAATVARYRGRIHFWEIWNEPNHPYYWDAPTDHLRRYTELLRASYRAAKRADPGCTVLNGGLAEPLIEGVRDLYANGAKEFFDILSIHIFIDPLASDRERLFDEKITEVKNVMNAHSDGGKGIWITEIGCPGSPADAKGRKWFAGGPVDEQQQADWLAAAYRLVAAHPEVEKTFWAFYRDTDGMFDDAAEHLGIVHFDLTPKPAFLKLQQLIRSSR